MKIVIDSNVIIAGLLKESIVREILVSKNNQFFLPENALEEIEKYKSEIIEKANYTDEEYEKLISFLLKNLNLISKTETKPFIKRGEEIMEKIDIKDSSFIAAALAINADGIWSFDKHFLQQKIIKIFKTEDITKETE